MLSSKTSALLRNIAAYFDTASDVLLEGFDDSEVLHCYSALRKEIRAQFDVLRAFVDVRFTATDPYPTSRAMFRDIELFRTLRVYTKADLPGHHPLALYAFDQGQGVIYNSVFRAVHDGLAHYPGRHDFGPSGELAAFRAHCRLLTRDAVRAVATETLAQNAWFNFGPHSHLPPKLRPFATQKVLLLPDSLIDAALEVE